MTHMVDTQVTVSPHRKLNTARGGLSDKDLLDSSEKEIFEGLRTSGIVAVKSIMLRRDGIKTPTQHLVVTLEGHTLPVLSRRDT